MRSLSVSLIAALTALAGSAHADVIDSIRADGVIISGHYALPSGNTAFFAINSAEGRVIFNTTGASRTSNSFGLRSLNETIATVTVDYSESNAEGGLGSSSFDHTGISLHEVATDGARFDVEACLEGADYSEEAFCSTPEVEVNGNTVHVVLHRVLLDDGPRVDADLTLVAAGQPHLVQNVVLTPSGTFLEAHAGSPGAFEHLVAHVKQVNGKLLFQQRVNQYDLAVISGTLTVDGQPVSLAGFQLALYDETQAVHVPLD